MVDIKNSLNSSHKPTKSEQNLTKFTSNQSQHNKSANNAFGKVAMNVMNVKKFASSKTQKEQSPQTKGEDQANSTGFKLKKIKLPPLKNLKGQKNQDHSKSINNMEYSQMNNENGPDIDHEQPQHTASPNHEKNQDKLRNQHDKVDNNSKTPQNNPFLSDYKIDTNIADQRTLKSNNSDNKHQNQSQQLQNDNKFSLPPISLSKLNIMDDKKPQNNDKKLTLQGVFSVADKASKLIGKKKKKKKKSLGVGGRDETYLENTIEDQQNDKQKDDQVCDSDSNNYCKRRVIFGKKYNQNKSIKKYKYIKIYLRKIIKSIFLEKVYYFQLFYLIMIRNQFQYNINLIIKLTRLIYNAKQYFHIQIMKNKNTSKIQEKKLNILKIYSKQFLYMHQ